MRVVVASGAVVVAIVVAEPTQAVPGTAPLDAVAAAEAFVNAIGRGDRAAVRELLLPEVLIFESGGSEQSAEEYLTRHLPADIRFMAGMKRGIQSQNTGGDQTMRWVATAARVRGTYKEKTVDLDSTETIVLTLTTAGWRITHIHWSSSPHRAASPAA